ncbi:uncharacterized protein ACRADG_012022 isoform 1-T3 [Cochliomyia hominivorax]
MFQSKSLRRQFSHTRFIFLLIIVLNTLDNKDQTSQPHLIYSQYFENDIKYCAQCFEPQVPQCLKFFKQIATHDEFSLMHLLNFLPQKPCKRNNQLIQLQPYNETIIAKYFYKNTFKMDNNSQISDIKKAFLVKQENLQGMQFMPLKSLDQFIKHLQSYQPKLNEISIWHYLLHDVQSIILPILEQLEFPVPHTYAICGFTLYQHFKGQDLYHFFQATFLQKLEISSQLLEAALKFSYGFNQYRLYITDFTADNIVFDILSNKLYFIDLDTIFIVDSTKAKFKSLTHKHEYIECPGCFAYSADDIASYHISDINIYLTCQFLREDLYHDRSKGFLYPIPEEISEIYPEFKQLLNKCVDCKDYLCLERFTVAKKLLKEFKKILKDFGQ